MPASTRFSVAVHMMALLATDRTRLMTSEVLAKSLSTNPAVVRRILGALVRAGLTTSQLGKGGGARLAKGPKKITLAEIYNAVETPGLIPMPRSAPDPACPVGGAIEPTLGAINDAAEAAFLASLEGVTLKQLAKEIAAVKAATKNAA